MPSSLPPSRRSFFSWLAAAAALFLATGPLPACAEVFITGTPEAVRVEARNASVGEALARLGATFDLKISTSIYLGRPIGGTYRGPVLKVVSRVLTDYDYVVKRSAEGRIEVIVIKASGKDRDKVISIYPDPRWHARSYPRTFYHPPPHFKRPDMPASP